MSKSSKQQVVQRAVVIHRNNELSQFVELLESLAVPVEVFPDALPSPEDLEDVAVVIVSGRRLTENGTPNLSLWPRTLAVVADSGKTLIAHLNRLGVSMVLQRPLHPKTLRLLLLHEVYRGPERRNLRRVLIGHPIRIGGTFLRQNGTLLELSPNGARIEIKGNPKVGSKLRLLIGKDLTHTKPLKIDVEVVRCIRASTKAKQGAEVGVSFRNPRSTAAEIAELLKRFSRGPATWNGKLDASPPSPTLDPALEQTMKMSTDTEPEPEPEPEPTDEIDPSESARRLPPSYAKTGQGRTLTRQFVKGESKPATTAPQASEEPNPDERRGDVRIPYDHRVVALGEEAARVLVGRDLSQGGMRIENSDCVNVGDVIRVALHSGSASDPLILMASALRSDGEDGTVLTFEEPTDAQREHLEQIIASSAPIQSAEDHPENGGGSIVLGEMLEKVVAAQSDDEVSAHIDSIFDTGEAVEDAR